MSGPRALTWHIQAPHKLTAETVDAINASGVGLVMMMDCHLISSSPFRPGVQVINRIYEPDSIDKEIWKRGADGAREWYARIRDRIVPWAIQETWNEPYISTPYLAQQFVEAGSVAVDLLHDHGVQCAINYGGTGNPPYMSIWETLGRLIDKPDWDTLHEYNLHLNDPAQYDGHMLRCVEVFAKLAALGIANEKPWAVTETGVDFDGNPRTSGWRARGLSAEQFIALMLRYDSLLPPQVRYAAIYTAHGYWPSFETAGEVTERLSRAYVEARPPEPLPEDEPSTDAATLADKCRWWLEEYTRQLEWGNTQRAEAILYSLINRDHGLFYRLERALK